MKSLCVVLLLAVSVPGCSRSSKSDRMERAYYKYLQQAQGARAKSRKNLTERERAQMRSLRTPPSRPVEQQTVEPAPENQ